MKTRDRRLFLLPVGAVGFGILGLMLARMIPLPIAELASTETAAPAPAPVPASVPPEEPMARLARLRQRLPVQTPPRSTHSEQPVDDDEKLRARFANDPVASIFPSLGDEPPARQLESLRWMRGLPPERIAAAIPSLQAIPPRERAAHLSLAREYVEASIALLEKQGHQAPEMPPGFTVAKLVDDPLLPPPMDPPSESTPEQDLTSR